jgi:hypothetical protein
VEDYNGYLDVYTNVIAQRARTQEELLDSWYGKDYVCLTENDPDYWIPCTNALEEYLKAKTVRL